MNPWRCVPNFRASPPIFPFSSSMKKFRQEIYNHQSKCKLPVKTRHYYVCFTGACIETLRLILDLIQKHGNFF